jgi:site-specific DNA-methyltransferase (adenine-specific)
MSNNDSTHAAVSSQVIQGDCIQMLQSLPGESIDAVITDPPYLVGYRDRSGRSIANDNNPSVLDAFSDIYRVLKPNSLCVCFYGWNRVDAFFRAWTQAGFRPVGHLVWAKSYASRVGFLEARHEQAYLLAKGRPNRPEAPLPDVQPWEYTGNVAHPTEKAVSILRPLVESFAPAGGIVLDPFAGSGSTLVAAALSGRGYVGIELEDKYCQLARRRLAGVERFMRRAA